MIGLPAALGPSFHCSPRTDLIHSCEFVEAHVYYVSPQWEALVRVVRGRDGATSSYSVDETLPMLASSWLPHWKVASALLAPVA